MDSDKYDVTALLFSDDDSAPEQPADAVPPTTTPADRKRKRDDAVVEEDLPTVSAERFEECANSVEESADEDIADDDVDGESWPERFLRLYRQEHELSEHVCEQRRLPVLLSSATACAPEAIAVGAWRVLSLLFRKSSATTLPCVFRALYPTTTADGTAVQWAASADTTLLIYLVEDADIYAWHAALGSELRSTLEGFVKPVLERALEALDGAPDDVVDELPAKLRLLARQCGIAASVGAVQRAVVDHELCASLDGNPRLLACRNGVFECDAATELYKFRPGTPADRVSADAVLDHEIPRSLPGSSQERQQVEREFRRLFRPLCDSDEQYEYVFDLLVFLVCAPRTAGATRLLARFTGRGGNGKSIIVTFLLCVAGKHSVIELAPILLCKALDPQKPNPELERASHARVVVFQEPLRDVVLQSATLKSVMDENGRVACRGLYQSARSVALRFNALVTDNLGDELRVDVTYNERPALQRRIAGVLEFTRTLDARVADVEDADRAAGVNNGLLLEQIDALAARWLVYAAMVRWPELVARQRTSGSYLRAYAPAIEARDRWLAHQVADPLEHWLLTVQRSGLLVRADAPPTGQSAVQFAHAAFLAARRAGARTRYPRATQSALRSHYLQWRKEHNLSEKRMERGRVLWAKLERYLGDKWIRGYDAHYLAKWVWI